MKSYKFFLFILLGTLPFCPAQALCGETAITAKSANGITKFYVNNRLVDTQFIAEGQIVDRGGVPDGIATCYFPSGKPEWKLRFRYGKGNGIQIVYSPEGWISAKVPYVDGQITGLKQGFSKSGKLLYEYTMVNGRMQGIAKKYFPDGHIQFRWGNKDDRPHGLHQTFYEDGRLKSESNYKNGVLDQDSVKIYPDADPGANPEAQLPH